MNLQINKIISTKDLTTSFQWNQSEAFFEHDINEFAKLLFEAIRMSLSQNTSLEKNMKIFDDYSQKNLGKSLTILQC